MKNVSDFAITAYEYSITNTFVDLFFNRGLYGDYLASTGLADDSFEVTNFTTSGGASTVAVTAVRQPNRFAVGDGIALVGGEEVIRVYFTVTGTPNSTETFQIQPVKNKVFDISGVGLSASKTTGSIKLNLTPRNLWDAKRASSMALSSTITTTQISTIEDLISGVVMSQGADGGRPEYFAGTRISFTKSQNDYFDGGDVGSMDFQQGDNFTVVIKGLIAANTAGQGGYIVSNKALGAVSNAGWTIQTGTDGSLFFSMHDGTTQNFADVDNFNLTNERTIICVNSGGVLSVYDENNTLIGVQGSTSITTIDYTGITFKMGARDIPSTSTTLLFNGYWEKIAIYASALSSDERVDLLGNFARVSLTPNYFIYPKKLAGGSSAVFDNYKIGAFVSYGMTTYTASDAYAVNHLLTAPAASTFAPPSNILTLAESWVDDLNATGKVDFYIFTTGHHIGYSMWDTQVTLKQQSIVDPVLGTINIPIRNPYKNSTYDIIGTLVDRARFYNKPVYLYYNLGRRINERGSGDYGSTDFYFQFIEAQLKELIDLYHPDGFFWDGQQQSPWIDNTEFSYLHRMYSVIKKYDPNILIITNEDDVDGSILVGGNLNKFPTDISCYERDIGRVLTSNGQYNYLGLKNWRGTSYVRNVCDIITTNSDIIYFGSEDKGATDRTQGAVQTYYDASKAVGVPLMINFSPSQDGTLQTSQVDFLTNLNL